MNQKRTKPTDNCPHGKECNRKNPHHFMEYTHEHLDKIIELNPTAKSVEQYEIPDDLLSQKDLILDQIRIVIGLFRKQSDAKRMKTSEPVAHSSDLSINSNPNRTMEQKLAAARPYNFFLTRVESSGRTHTEPLSITFQEILCPSLGKLECSVQINFVVDPNWLINQYISAGHLDKDLLVIHGRQDAEVLSTFGPQIKTHFVQMPQLATHHTKMMLLGYTDGSMRVVVSTANLYEPDWTDRAQGLWMSDKLDAMPDGSDTAAGESKTDFRNELVTYLSLYGTQKLQPWIQRIRNTNFTKVNVFLVTSVPGTHPNTNSGGPYAHAHGHGRVAHLLSQHSAEIDESTPIIAQCSAIGNFGTGIEQWLTTDIVSSFGRNSRPNGSGKELDIRIIYPSIENVRNCYGGILGADCLPYGREAHQKQLWLNNFLYQWRADGRYRSNAVPHIKTYCRRDEKKLYWFMLTSGNLSKAAWGTLSKAKSNPTLRISNYEAGVLFLPKFVTNTNYFSMDRLDDSTAVFPSVYDIPLTKYTATDEPFFIDNLAMAMPGAQNCNPM